MEIQGNSMKAREIMQTFTDVYGINIERDAHIYSACMQMAKWKDEQYKTAYVVTRIDLHYDEVEKIFFDKNKAEEYCASFNKDENSYHRNITEIEVSL